MTLRTPRRRISPRTKRRYRAIREFFRRALGNPSEQEIKINSSIAVNVTNLKRKIVGFENRLDAENQICHHLECPEKDFRRNAEHLLSKGNDDITFTEQGKTGGAADKIKANDTEVLYKKPEEPIKHSDDSEYVYSYESNSEDRHEIDMDPEGTCTKHKKYKQGEVDFGTCHSKLRKHRARSNFENLSAEYTTSSFHSLSEVPLSQREHCKFSKHHQHERKYSRRPDFDTAVFKEHRKNKEQSKRYKSESPSKQERKKSRHKPEISVVDHDFIAHIIKKQYKPMKLFGSRPSELSQFSAPVCRDQEFPLKENILEGDLCSCCYNQNYSKYERTHGLSDMRSICDTRLYSANRHARHKNSRRQHVDVYNDSALYDLVPVKEKASPKSRRKFVEDNLVPIQYYREVPPSPRTLRPRLNLRAQRHAEFFDGYTTYVKRPKNKRQPVAYTIPQELDSVESDTSEIMQIIKPKEVKTKPPNKIQMKNFQTSPEVGTSTMHSCSGNNDIILASTSGNNDVVLTSTYGNNSCSLSKTQETDSSVDKTDKALCEIKDILQSFLQEIKKDTSQSLCNASYPSKTIPPTKEQLIGETPNISRLNTGTAQNDYNNNCSTTQCPRAPYITPFTNTCCYPLIPFYHMNCPKGNYVMPSPSCTCQTCENQDKGVICDDCCKHHDGGANGTSNGNKHGKNTEDLIKEIYRFVAEGPQGCKSKNKEKNENPQKKEHDFGEKHFVTRSVGSSTTRAIRNNAKVGTPTLKCYSKSCEALGSRIASDSLYTTTTQSDTVLDKLSLEASHSTSQLSLDTIIAKKDKKRGFAKVLQSFFRKKKKAESEEFSDTMSSYEVDIRPKSRSPYMSTRYEQQRHADRGFHFVKRPYQHDTGVYQQERGPYNRDVINYMMHGQEFCHRPPVPPHYQHAGAYCYSPRGYGSKNPCPCVISHHQGLSECFTPHKVHHDTIHEHSPAHYSSGSSDFSPISPCGTPCNQHYNHPNPPLCLKEVEVRSTGTQSDKKISFFNRLAMSSPPRVRSAFPVKSSAHMPTALQKATNNDSKKPQQKNNKRGNFNGKDEPVQEKKKGFLSGFKNLLEEKAKEMENDPMRYTLGTRKKLAEGDMKNRNKLLKKFLYKRNPFSAKNMLMNSIIGKDKSFDPMTIRRPRFML